MYQFVKDSIGLEAQDEMIAELAIREFEMLGDRDIIGILMHGCMGWENKDEQGIIEEYLELTGETDTEWIQKGAIEIIIEGEPL